MSCFVLLSEFSLDKWLKQNSVPDITNLLPSVIDKLMKETGLAEYLNADQCDRTDFPYAASVNNWRTGLLFTHELIARLTFSDCINAFLNISNKHLQGIFPNCSG